MRLLPKKEPGRELVPLDDVIAAVVTYYAKWPILIIAALIGFFRGLYWLCDRYPRTTFVILAIVNGMLGRRR